MGYIKAEQVLPEEVLEIIQNYIDGECIYIPRKAESRKIWGENTSIRRELDTRNQQIYNDYVSGMKTTRLADKYFLSVKSVQRIIRDMKRAA